MRNTNFGSSCARAIKTLRRKFQGFPLQHLVDPLPLIDCYGDGEHPIKLTVYEDSCLVPEFIFQSGGTPQ
jgi:hypothetical protein